MQSYKLDVICQAALTVESSSDCCLLFQQATDDVALVIVLWHLVTVGLRSYELYNNQLHRKNTQNTLKL